MFDRIKDLVVSSKLEPDERNRVLRVLSVFKDLPSLVESELKNLRIFEKGKSDIVTSADLAVESFIIDSITANFPQDMILSEESGWRGADFQYLHILDPIDLTRNVPRGQQFLSLYSLRKKDQPILSLIMAYRPFYSFVGINSVGVFTVTQGDSGLSTRKLESITSSSLSSELRYVTVHNFRVEKHNVDVNYYIGSSRSFMLGVLENEIDCCVLTLDEIGRQWGFYAWDYLPFLDLLHISTYAQVIFLPKGELEISEEGKLYSSGVPVEGLYVFSSMRKEDSLKFFSQLG